ncbi:MAG: hypothetical protein CMM01_02875 [Rhodopirellula sp.]|nr:hypothetical protein [Rhodopirellula sp.]
MSDVPPEKRGFPRRPQYRRRWSVDERAQFETFVLIRKNQNAFHLLPAENLDHRMNVVCPMAMSPVTKQEENELATKSHALFTRSRDAPKP